MKTEIFKTIKDFENRPDKLINGVSEEFAKNNSDYEIDNSSNEGCWNCVSCRDCTECTECTYCVECADCRNCEGCVDCIDKENLKTREINFL